MITEPGPLLTFRPLIFSRGSYEFLVRSCESTPGVSGCLYEHGKSDSRELVALMVTKSFGPKLIGDMNPFSCTVIT